MQMNIKTKTRISPDEARLKYPPANMWSDLGTDQPLADLRPRAGWRRVRIGLPTTSSSHQGQDRRLAGLARLQHPLVDAELRPAKQVRWMWVPRP